MFLRALVVSAALIPALAFGETKTAPAEKMCDIVQPLEILEYFAAPGTFKTFLEGRNATISFSSGDSWIVPAGMACSPKRQWNGMECEICRDNAGRPLKISLPKNAIVYVQENDPTTLRFPFQDPKGLEMKCHTLKGKDLDLDKLSLREFATNFGGESFLIPCDVYKVDEVQKRAPKQQKKGKSSRTTASEGKSFPGGDRA